MPCRAKASENGRNEHNPRFVFSGRSLSSQVDVLAGAPLCRVAAGGSEGNQGRAGRRHAAEQSRGGGRAMPARPRAVARQCPTRPRPERKPRMAIVAKTEMTRASGTACPRPYDDDDRGSFYRIMTSRRASRYRDERRANRDERIERAVRDERRVVREGSPRPWRPVGHSRGVAR